MTTSSRRKPKRASATRRPLVASLYSESPEWVKQMHSHFQQKGTYRAEDVQRVLGDSRESVRTGAVSSSQFACSIVVK